jgi:hypothetical protein
MWQVSQLVDTVWDHFDTPAPTATNLFFLSDGDLVAGNFQSGTSSASGVISGMFVAGEEVWFGQALGARGVESRGEPLLLRGADGSRR